MNKILLEKISTYIAKLSMIKAFLHNQPKDKIKNTILELTGINIDELEKQLNQ